MSDTVTPQTGAAPAKGDWKSPQEIYHALQIVWRKLEREKFDLEAFRREKPLSYFNGKTSCDKMSEYDRMFHFYEEFDPKKKREDRQNINIIRNRIFMEEEKRILPVVTSHIYGHRKTNLEGKTLSRYRRVDHLQDSYRRRNINLKPTKKSLTTENWN